MNIKTTLLTTLFIAISLVGLAQTTGKITGTIIDGGDQKIIDAATISLLRAKDSGLVKLSLTDKDGNFTFENLKNGNYLVMASSVGRRKVYSNPVIFTEGTNTSVGTLKLVQQTTTIQTVNVETKKPFIERQIDKTVLNVDALISNAGSNALEVLEKAPGVTVDKDGNISLKGKSGVIIMMDGKPSYLSGQQLSNLLKSMPSSALEQVEIMTNPSAKYDASGNSGIINLRTKKTKMIGFNGSNATTYSQGVYARFSNSTNVNYRKGKVNLFGNYSYSKRTGFEDMTITRNFRNSSNQIESRFDQNTFIKNSGYSHNSKAGLDFYATNKTTLGIVLSGYTNPRYVDGLNTSLLKNGSGSIDSVLFALNNEENEYNNFGTNINLRHVIDSTKKEITADFDYRTYTQSTNQLFTNNYLDANMTKRRNSSLLRGDLPSDIKIYSGRIDYSMPLKKGGKFETGVKSSYVTTDNNALYENNNGSGFEVDYEKTNHFIYKENINAAYVNFNKQYKKFGLQTGLRIENTIADGHQFGNAQRPDSAFKRNYTNIFPTIYLSYNLNKNNNINLNFGRRIDRPSYQDLNPFYYFLDEYTYKVGNTLLKPQFTNSVEFSHTYKGFLTTTLNYSKTTDVFADVLDQAKPKTFLRETNIATRENLGFAVSANFPVNKIWSANIYGNVVNNKYYGNVNTAVLDVNATMFMMNVSNQFKFKKGWSAELSGFYRSKGIEGQMIANSIWSLTSAVQKQVLKTKGTLKLSVSDIFFSQKFTGSVRYQDIDVKIAGLNDTRRASLTFTYRFGKPIQNQPRKKTNGLDEETRVKG